MLDALCEFQHAFPGLLGKDGYPLSWRHYIYGMQYLQRSRARDALRTATSTGIAVNASQDQWREWADTQRGIAGW